MSLETLKLKIRSHAAEATIIRGQEQRVLLDARILRYRMEHVGMPPRAIARILRRIPSKRRRILGKPAPRGSGDYQSEFMQRHFAMRAHRTCELKATSKRDGKGRAIMRDESLRCETRHSLLAYGFLRGRKFKQMEALSYVPPDFDRVFSIAARFAEETSPPDNRSLAQRFEDWKAEAGEWRHPHAKPTQSDDYKGADKD